MIGSVNFARPVFNLIVCASLLGCSATGRNVLSVQELTHMPAAPLGISEAGDKYYYANGRREKVTDVEHGLINIRRSSTYQYSRFQDFILTEKIVNSSNAFTTTDVVELNPEASLWPLEMGKSVEFSVVKTRAGKADGTPINSSNSWECSVDGIQKITVISGEFDTYRIGCIRKDSRNKIKQYVTYYYAPTIQQVVLRVDGYPYKPTKRVELVAFKPALSKLSKGSTRRYEQHFQNTLETVTSGTTTSWWSRRSGTRIHTTPTNTLKVALNLYCRNYLVRINLKGSVRSGAGLACRNDKGQWRIPNKVDIDNGKFIF